MPEPHDEDKIAEDLRELEQVRQLTMQQMFPRRGSRRSAVSGDSFRSSKR